MDFIKMIMELPGEKRSQGVVESVEWNNLWRQSVIQGNHSENYLQELHDYLFDQVEGWVYKVQAELDGVQPYIEGVMTQPVGKAPDGSLWTYSAAEGSTTPWGYLIGDIINQHDLMQMFETKAAATHEHDMDTLIFAEGDLNGSWIADGTISEPAYGSRSIPTGALQKLSVTSEELAKDCVTSDKLPLGVVTRSKLAQDALHSPIIRLSGSRPDHTISLADDGKTIMTMTSGASYSVTLSKEVGVELPEGFEIALCLYYGNKLSLSIGADLYIGHPDHGKTKTGRTFEIVEQNTMVALKKMLHYNGVAYWQLTGNVEVAS